MTDSINHSARPPIQGLTLTPGNDHERLAAVEQAFDYRGDVTLITTDGRTIEGYIFDRRPRAVPPTLRLIQRSDGSRIQLDYAQVSQIIFSGRDTAEGKSWETWVKKWEEKKAKGEVASIEAEKLEE
ncbi:MAG: hypothetical protein HC898_06875 [Phycisphaerales bacterium]|nr:hypothetical protein [Phycisphaerales bacterium]